jgi:Domain of unknown function (DUF397)
MRNTWNGVTWRKSSHSPDWDDCVELAPAGTTIGVRDSKDPNGPVLEFGRRDMAILLDQVRSGGLDL